MTIVGMGLIGGSWGMALKRTIPEINICGVDLNLETLNLGIKTRCADRVTTSLQEGVKDADLVIIATLVSSIAELTRQIIPFVKAGCIITDVGSTKTELINKVRQDLPKDIFYIPGHPMAGSEACGISGADSYLFENAVYVLTPDDNTNKNALATVKKLVEAIGARVLILKPEEHDLKVAAVSHLPHVVAAALVNTVGDLENKSGGFLELVAGGFRDITRIADSQPSMWQDIFLQNRKGIIETISVFRESLEKLEKAIADAKGDEIINLLDKAQKERTKIPAKSKGVLPELFEIIATVPDKPGIIGNLANLLGEHEINIIDIEILRVREGDGGTIRFGFQDREQALKAIEVFLGKGYVAKLKE